MIPYIKNINIKKFIILIICFLLLLWFQNKDDKRNNRVRKSFFDKIKLPLLVSSIIGFIFTINELFSNQIIEENEPVIPKTIVNKKYLSRNSLTDFNQDIDLNPPDF